MPNLSEGLRQLFPIDQLTSEVIVALLMFAVTAAMGLTVYYVFSRYFSRWAQKTKTNLDDEVLRSIRIMVVLLIITVGIYYALTSLSLISPYEAELAKIFSVVQILLVAFAITRVTNVLVDWYASRQVGQQSGKNNHLMFILKKAIQLVVYVMAFVVILYVFEIDLSGVVVGLGVGGIAIALAVQNTLSDVFSAFSIYFDHPFEIGDFVVIGEHSGTVTNIGVKSTRIKLLQGEELIISNKELTSTRIRNFRKLEKRRITFTLGVVYGTPSDKLRRIIEIVTQIINNIDVAELDRVHFAKFGDFSLIFEVVYYMKVPGYREYMDTQQKINFEIKDAFEKEGIEMAFPTQTLYLKTTSDTGSLFQQKE
ncbi:MAG: mechanosensitive ion channel family protein [Candidatus Bathyarchaeota archaeon]|nr:mechanosensitive ion channel family protein [Candidatus Bathyarchaeota archaeon]